MDVTRGRVPGWALRGDGYGYGGDGYGDGSGGDAGAVVAAAGDLERCAPSPVTVTARHLKLHEACGEAVSLFKRTFPSGAEFPRDIPAALDAGLDIGWACEELGLLMPLTEDIPA